MEDIEQRLSNLIEKQNKEKIRYQVQLENYNVLLAELCNQINNTDAMETLSKYLPEEVELIKRIKEKQTDIGEPDINELIRIIFDYTKLINKELDRLEVM